SAHCHHLVKKSVLESSTLRGLFCAPDGGRRSNDSTPHLRAQYTFCHCWSVARSWTENASCCAPSFVFAVGSPALRTSRFRTITLLTCPPEPPPPSGCCQVASTSTWSPSFSVPTSNSFSSPESCIARSLPRSCARMPSSCEVPNRSAVICSPR